MWDLGPRPGIEPGALHWELGVLHLPTFTGPTQVLPHGRSWGWWREKGVAQGTSGGDWVPLPWVQRFSHLLGFQLLTPVPGKEASSFLEGEEQACKQPLCLVRPPGTRCKNSDYYQEKQCNV